MRGTFYVVMTIRNLCCLFLGDLKSSHVFESTSKVDTFPTPTDFDPTVAAATLPIPTASQPQTSATPNGTSHPDR